MLEKWYKLPTDTEGTFHSEVYYVNMTTRMGIKWGTDSKVRMFDPYSGMHVELGASGEFNIRVINSRKLLLKLVGTADGLKQAQLTGDGGKSYFRSMVMTNVKSFLASAIKDNAINVLEIDEHLMKLSASLLNKINPQLAEYGLEMTEFFVSRIVTPDDDPNFARMKKQYGERFVLQQQGQIDQIAAQNKVQVELIGAQGSAEMTRIAAQAEADAYRMKAAAEAEEMRMKGYTYQQETARQVGTEAMKNGITGGNGGGMGDIASLGLTLCAMGSVVNMTKDALNPVMESSAQMGQAVGTAMAGGWDCACGPKNIGTNVCHNCGTKTPEPKLGWSCSCGQQNITSNFCPNCGAKRPEADLGWDCPQCGQKGNQTNFCPNCGHKR